VALGQHRLAGSASQIRRKVSRELVPRPAILHRRFLQEHFEIVGMGFMRESFGKAPVTILLRKTERFSPIKRQLPVTISKSVIPALQMSLPLSTSLPRICSGDI
jgi:hypothetical protein